MIVNPRLIYSTQQEQEREIAERLLATFHACCDQCDQQSDLKAVDLEDAVTGFYIDGWRVAAIDADDPVSDKLLCKNCVRANNAER